MYVPLLPKFFWDSNICLKRLPKWHPLSSEKVRFGFWHTPSSGSQPVHFATKCVSLWKISQHFIYTWSLSHSLLQANTREWHSRGRLSHLGKLRKVGEVPVHIVNLGVGSQGTGTWSKLLPVKQNITWNRIVWLIKNTISSCTDFSHRRLPSFCPHPKFF